MKDLTARVIGNREVARQTFLLSLECPLEGFRPGQFVMLKAGRTHDPLLRRPLGILACQAGILALLYKIKGVGTRLLSQLEEGDRLAVLGPLGNGFTPPPAEMEIVYAAGGTGLPPIAALAAHLKRGTFVYGARTQAEIPFECLPRDVRIATEDGTHGEPGLLTRILTIPQRPVTVYACGPKGMLQAVAAIAARHGARCQVSLEERMACGFGVCSGCAVETASGIRRVCADGPVFDAEDIVW